MLNSSFSDQKEIPDKAEDWKVSAKLGLLQELTVFRSTWTRCTQPAQDEDSTGHLLHPTFHLVEGTGVLPEVLSGR